MQDILTSTIRFDIQNNDYCFSITNLYLIDYACEQFEKRFYCQPDSDIKLFISSKIETYMNKHSIHINSCYEENTKKCINTILKRINGILSDLIKYRNKCSNINALIELKNAGLMFISDCDRFYNDSESDRFLAASEFFDETEE